MSSLSPALIFSGWHKQNCSESQEDMQTSKRLHFTDAFQRQRGVFYAQRQSVFFREEEKVPVSPCSNGVIIYDSNSIFSDAFCQNQYTQWLLPEWWASRSSPPTLCLCLTLAVASQGRLQEFVMFSASLSNQSSLGYLKIILRLPSTRSQAGGPTHNCRHVCRALQPP